MSKHPWKAELEPFAQIVAEAEAAIEDRLAPLSVKELVALERACAYPTQTNCWFATYQAAQKIRGRVQMLLKDHSAGRRP